MNPEYFKVCNGEIIKHYSELPDALERMSVNEFNMHVNEYKNDFSRWLYETYGLSHLAGVLGEIKSKQETKRVLNAYLAMTEYKFKFKEPSSNAPTEDRPNKEKSKLPLFSNMFKFEKQTNENSITSVKIDETDADKYFKEHPVIVSQQIEAKKDSLVLEKLSIIRYTESETVQQLITLFKDNYAKAYSQIVFLRKSGFDTKLAEVMLFRIPPKIKVYEASQEAKDSVVIKRYLNEAIEEINSIR